MGRKSINSRNFVYTTVAQTLLLVCAEHGSVTAVSSDRSSSGREEAGPEGLEGQSCLLRGFDGVELVLAVLSFTWWILIHIGNDFYAHSTTRRGVEVSRPPSPQWCRVHCPEIALARRLSGCRDQTHGDPAVIPPEWFEWNRNQPYQEDRTQQLGTQTHRIMTCLSKYRKYTESFQK